MSDIVGLLHYIKLGEDRIMSYIDKLSFFWDKEKIFFKFPSEFVESFFCNEIS